MSFRKIVKSSFRVPEIYSNDENKDQIIQKWDPTTGKLVNIRILFKIEGVVLRMNSTGFITGWTTNISGPGGVIRIYDNGDSLVPGSGTAILTIETPPSKRAENTFTIPAEIIGNRNYYFILYINNQNFVSNVVSYPPTLLSGPTTSVTSNAIISNFEYDLVPSGSILRFYDNGLTNSNVGGNVVATVSSITNKINSISRSNDNIAGNYYYSAILFNGILYKSPQVRLVPILNSVALDMVNRTTDVITVSNVSVSVPCNLEFKFYQTISDRFGQRIGASNIFTRILSSSSAASYASSGIRISTDSKIKYYVIIQALDSSGRIITESESKTSGLISSTETNPTVNSAAVSSVTPTGYTATWTLSIPSRVKVTLYLNSSDSNSGGTLVSSRTFNVEDAKTQNITEDIGGTGFYYVIIQPVDYANANIGTTRSSSTFFTTYAISVIVTSFSATQYVANWSLSRSSNYRLSLYSNTTQSNTGGIFVRDDDYNSIGDSDIRTVTGLSLTPTTRYYYVILQPRTAAGANYGKPDTSLVFGNPTVSAVTLAVVHRIRRYTVTWSIALASRVKITLYLKPAGGSNELVSTSFFDSTTGVNTRTVTNISISNVARSYFVIVQPVRLNNNNIGTPFTSSIVTSTNA